MKPSPRILISTLLVLSLFSWLGRGTAAAAPAIGISRSTHTSVHAAPHLRRMNPAVARQLAEEARRLQAAPLRPQRHLTRQADGHLRSNVSCPAGGTWFGLPYLNRFYSGYTDNNGNCAYLVEPHEFTGSTSWDGTPVLMESYVIIDPGVTITSSSAIVDMKAAGQAYADLYVRGELDLSAGASMQFNCDCGIYVSGTLHVSGSSQQPVSMSLTPVLPQVNNWEGIAFDAGSHGMVSYLDMEQGGLGQEDCDRCGGLPAETTDMVIGSSDVNISNSAFNTSADKGIEVIQGITPTLTNDSFSGNAGSAVQYDYATDLSLDSGLSATGAHPELRMLGGTINGSATWPSGLGLPIHADAIQVGYNAHLTLDTGTAVSDMAGTLTVYPGAQFTVNAGTTVAFGCQCGLRILQAASVAMSGTEASPIVFTSAQATPAPGDWAGMTLNGTNISLANVRVLYAGSGIYPCDVCITYNVGILLDAGSPSLTNVTVRYSSGDGIEAIDAGTPTITDATLQNNGAWPLHYDRPSDLSTVSGLVTGGNGHEEIRMGSGSVGSAMRWANLGLPLHVDGDIGLGYNIPLTVDAGTNIATIGTIVIPQGAQLSLGPGATIHEASLKYIQVAGGTLSLPGTAQQHITLTGVTDAVGSWGGIIMYSGGTGSLDYVDLSDAGSGTYACCSGPFHAAIFISDTSPSITHTTISNSVANDIEVGGFGQGNPTLLGDSFLAVPSGFYGVLNDTQSTVTAQCDFWGDASGPYNASANPNGLGTPVSDRVSFNPWLPNCGKPTAPQNLQLTPSGTSVTVTWNPPASDGGNAIDRYDVTVNPHGQTGAAPTSVDPATGCAGSGPVTCTTVAGSLTPGASYDITVSAHNSAGSGPAAGGTVLVPNPNLPPVLTLPADQSVQYSDPLTFGVSAADQDGDPVTLGASGLPAGLSFQDNGNGTGTVSGNEAGPAGGYVVTFTASDGIVQVSKKLTITVTPENATVASSDPAILAAQAGQPLTLHATITDANDGSPGNINLATPVTFTLTPYSAAGPLDPAHAVACTTPTSGGGVGTAAAKAQASYAASCTLNSLGVGAYKETITVGGSYYQGSYDPWIAVFSPSAGSLNGEALLRHNGARAHISDEARYTPGDGKGHAIRLEGRVEYTEQRSGASPLTFRSTSLTALSVVGGKTAFVLGYGSVNGMPGYRFLLTAIDGSPGGHDQVGLQVLDPSGHPVPTLTFAPIPIDAGQVTVHTH